MSVMEPKIDTLLDDTEYDRYLLCSVASRRARDINDMIRGQRARAAAVPGTTVSALSDLAGRKPLSLALEEIERGEVSYDSEALHSDNL